MRVRHRVDTGKQTTSKNQMKLETFPQKVYVTLCNLSPPSIQHIDLKKTEDCSS